MPRSLGKTKFTRKERAALKTLKKAYRDYKKDQAVKRIAVSPPRLHPSPSAPPYLPSSFSPNTRAAFRKAYPDVSGLGRRRHKSHRRHKSQRRHKSHRRHKSKGRGHASSCKRKTRRR